jgi:hypothetical protein
VRFTTDKDLARATFLNILANVTPVILGLAFLPLNSCWRGPLPFGLTSLPQPVTIGLAAVVGLALALPAMASGDSIARRAAELPQPRLPGLMRTARLAAIFGLLVTAGAGFAIVA